MTDLIFKEEVYAVVGAAMEVHRENGSGFAEPIYQECLGIEMASRKIPFEAQKQLPFFYKSRLIEKTYIADFVAYGKIVVELKALEKLASREEAQLLNYLKISRMEVGVLINFGSPSLEWKRIVLSRLPAKPINIQ